MLTDTSENITFPMTHPHDVYFNSNQSKTLIFDEPDGVRTLVVHTESTIKAYFRQKVNLV